MAIIHGCRERLAADRLHSTNPSIFKGYIAVLQSILGEEWLPKRVARDGCELPTVSNTVSELALSFAHLAQDKDND